VSHPQDRELIGLRKFRQPSPLDLIRFLMRRLLHQRPSGRNGGSG
jgi:hypothetical protein